MLTFNIFHTKVELHYSFFVLLFSIVYSGDVIFAAASALFSFIHEFVHKITATRLGYSTEKISFGLFGGILHLRDSFVKPIDELLIHLAGPLFNIIMAILLYGCYLYFYFPWLKPVVFANATLALFNLMPFYPLDGGKVADLYLAIFLGYGRSQKISRAISLFFTVFLFLLGIYLVQYNILNLFVSALAVNLYAARKMDNSFIFYKITRNIEEGSNKSGSEKIVVCKEDMKAIKIIERFKPLESRIFTIVNGKGKYRGQLTETEFLDGIYYCGIYADFNKLLDFKRKK